jgi:CubicO group peptidase (beta-lactamase class C family)
MKHSLFILITSFLFYTSSAVAQKEDINKTISKHGKAFLKNKNIRSVSIGIFKDGEKYSQHFGELEKGKGNTPTNKTIYEIASVTKTMTGYLVAKAVAEGKLKLEDDVRKYLKANYPNLEFSGEPITIQHLLTHTAGLPKFLPLEMNSIFVKSNQNAPSQYYELEKNYSKKQFLDDLKSISISSAPGTNYSYSNAGAELIGCILEAVYKKNIDELLKESFLNKYGGKNTVIHLKETQKVNLARGYWLENKKFSPNQLNTLWATGSGAKMNLSDMLNYIVLQLNSEDSIVSKSHQILFEEGNTLKIGYFWRVWKDKYGTSYNHHGGTSGIQNWLFIYPKYNLGISIITNQSDFKTPSLLSKTAKKILKDIVEE